MVIILSIIDSKVKYTLISDYLKGKPFFISYTIANNKTSLFTNNILTNTEVDKYLFVSRYFAERLT